MFEKEFFSLNPIHFFAISCDCHHLTQKDEIPSLITHSLPTSEKLTQEIPFAKVAMGWHEEGISVHIQVSQPAKESFYPALEQGDSIELFFDTRDLKSSGFNTRFCHHFFFCLGQAKESLKGKSHISGQKIIIRSVIHKLFIVRRN